jgi:hypothetical protein
MNDTYAEQQRKHETTTSQLRAEAAAREAALQERARQAAELSQQLEAASAALAEQQRKAESFRQLQQTTTQQLEALRQTHTVGGLSRRGCCCAALTVVAKVAKVARLYPQAPRTPYASALLAGDIVLLCFGVAAAQLHCISCYCGRPRCDCCAQVHVHVRLSTPVLLMYLAPGGACLQGLAAKKLRLEGEVGKQREELERVRAELDQKSAAANQARAYAAQVQANLANLLTALG